MGTEMRQHFRLHICRASACSRPPDDSSSLDQNESFLDHFWIAFREELITTGSHLMQASIIHGILWPFFLMRAPT